MNNLAIWRVISAVVLVVSTSSATEGTKRFDGYKVYRAVPATEKQLNLFKSLEHGDVDDVSVWSSAGVVNGEVDVMVSPATEAQILAAFRESGVSYEILIKDVQSLIDNQNPEVRESTPGHRSRRSVDQVTSLNWTAYHPLDTIYNWIDGLAKTYPDLVEVLNIGSSYEGRPIKGIKITFNKTNPGIVVEGGIHGQEWISPATATHLINEILSGTNATFNAVARAHTWFIFPVLNPDGYAYTFTTNRLWRKNRKPFANNCTGVDLDRNWNFHWMANGGASQNACSEAYGGPQPNSEVETQAFSDYISSISDQFYIYLSLRGYGLLVLVPYAWTYERPANYNESMAVGTKAVEALGMTFGAVYIVGAASELSYVSSGGSADYMKGVLGTRFVYTYELRDNGEYGWLLPADQISDTAVETTDSITALIAEAHKLTYENTV